VAGPARKLEVRILGPLEVISGGQPIAIGGPKQAAVLAFLATRPRATVSTDVHRVERATAYLESLGLRVRLMPNAARTDRWASAPPEDRVADLHASFADDEVAVVLAAIGGNHCNQLLPLLDFDLIRSHPKIFQGYSNVTVLHWAIVKHAGLGTFYGPALIPELGEFPDVLPHTDRYLRAAWFGDEPFGYEPAAVWTDELLDFDTKADLTRARELRESGGWITIREGTARGALFGGCLETICWHLKGSNAWMVTVPLGVNAVIDAKRKLSRLLETPTAPRDLR
jgi:muramoyltetrapeptide carboxypeptidase LdcA involved in peptidoglycan recycling